MCISKHTVHANPKSANVKTEKINHNDNFKNTDQSNIMFHVCNPSIDA